MKYITIFRLVFIIFLSSTLYSCDSFDETKDTKKVGALTARLKMNILQEGLTEVSNLKVSLQNHEERLKIDIPISVDLPNTSIEVDVKDLIPGIYDIQISGKAEDEYHIEYNLGGGQDKVLILGDNELLEYNVEAMAQKFLLFKELYYSGCRMPNGVSPWFRDQYYEIYNNGKDTTYLDGLHFAHLHPHTATSKMPLWPESDGDKYVYSQWVWKIPGEGTDYPLAPGESVILSQWAVDQRIELHNPEVPVNNFLSDFEFMIENPSYPEGRAPNMELVFFEGYNHSGKSKQYLTTARGAAFVIFQIPEDEIYDPVNDVNMKTQDLSASSTKYYAKIPREYIQDAVEAGDNVSMIQYKRMPIALDAGMTTVGAQYIGKSVSRKVKGYNEDGTPILQDTNNSTNDFETGLVPEFRRHGAKMPKWNHTLIGR